jgi:hypothetical protein
MAGDELFWMTAKRNGVCVECAEDIKEGTRMVYNPVHYKAYCKTCGEEMIGPDGNAKPDLEEARKYARQKYQRRSKKPNTSKKENGD